MSGRAKPWDLSGFQRGIALKNNTSCIIMLERTRSVPTMD